MWRSSSSPFPSRLSSCRIDKKIALLFAIIVAVVFFWNHPYTRVPSSLPSGHDQTRPRIPPVHDQTSPHPQDTCALELMLAINASVLYLTRTTTDPSFIFANLNSGSLSSNVVNHGSFAPIETILFKNILADRCRESPVPMVVDVGGNMGYFSTYAGKFGCRVKTYEPTPHPRRFIHLNTMLNRLDSLVEVFPYVVGKDNTVVSMDLRTDWGLSQVTPEGSFMVESVTLRDIINEDVLLLKIDTEGHESQVLYSALDLLKKVTIENLIVETKHYEQDWMRNFINEMRKDYYIISYQEEYSTANHYKTIPDIICNSIPVLSQNDWFRSEDLWYIKKDSRTYEKVKNLLKCDLKV